jgi:hypothetical protein
MDNLGAFLSSGVTVPGSWQDGDFPGKLPLTIFFKTGVTKLGLLQITGFTENPRGVKIRYKLVQSPTDSPVLNPIQLEPASRSTALALAPAIGRVSEPQKAATASLTGPAQPEPQPVKRKTSPATETTVTVVAAGTAPLTYQLQYDATNFTRASAPATGSAAPTHPPFVARVAHGEIELLALSRHPSTNQPWWKPDGTPWTNTAFQSPASHSSFNKGQRFEFVFQRRGLPEDTTLDYSFEPGTGEVSSGNPPLRQGKSVSDHYLVVPLLPESAKEVTIRLGVAAGEWKTMVARTPQAGMGSSFTLGKQTCTALFLDPVESGGEARVGVSYNKVPGWTIRMTALDTRGQLHVSFPHGQSVDDVATTEGRFPGLPLSRVKEFRFEARPFAWVEFRNVSLEPGQRTQVQIVDAEGK